jgi:hypothetical protein
MVMLRLSLVLMVFLSGIVSAHEIQFSNQYIQINKQNTQGFQSTLIGRAEVNQKWNVGILANYLERFSFYENRLGMLATYKPNDLFTIEARFIKAEGGTKILPQDQYRMTVYHRLSEGLTPFFSYQDSTYSITHLQTVNFGMEIEKIKHFIVIPQLMMGRAKFKDPVNSREVNSIGLKIMYSVENNYAFFLFANKGIEASQSVTGVAAKTLNTKTSGLGANYYFNPTIKVEGLFDYTDYEELSNQFLTSTINLTWMF